MSLRRKSCDACFKRRQKCDRSFPVCLTCQRLKKLCHYPFQPDAPAHVAASSLQEAGSGREIDVSTMVEEFFSGSLTSYVYDNVHRCVEHRLAFLEQEIPTNLLDPTSLQVISSEAMNIMIPNLLGPLGDTQPLVGHTQTWQWVIAQFKDCLAEFARKGSNVFIHEKLYPGTLPRPIRTAFTLSNAVYGSMNEDNRSTLFKVLDAEVLEIQQLPNEAVIEDLAKLQALVLCHIIRLFYGTAEQRVMAELQESSLMERALYLLQRSQSDIQNDKRDWYSWIVAECIRRTTIITFLLCGIHSILTRGICLTFPTLQMLPVSSESTAWASQESYLHLTHPNKTISYTDFTSDWLYAPRNVASFEKLVLVACKGVNTVEACNGFEP